MATGSNILLWDLVDHAQTHSQLYLPASLDTMLMGLVVECYVCGPRSMHGYSALCFGSGMNYA